MLSDNFVSIFPKHDDFAIHIANEIKERLECPETPIEPIKPVRIYAEENRERLSVIIRIFFVQNGAGNLWSKEFSRFLIEENRDNEEFWKFFVDRIVREIRYTLLEDCEKKLKKELNAEKTKVCFSGKNLVFRKGKEPEPSDSDAAWGFAEDVAKLTPRPVTKFEFPPPIMMRY